MSERLGARPEIDRSKLNIAVERADLNKCLAGHHRQAAEMRASYRPSAPTRNHSESGLISVSAVLGIAFVALIVYLLLGALNGDSDHYGRVPIPSQNVAIELPKGEIDLYLAVQGDPDRLGDLAVPADFQFSVASTQGDAVRIDGRNGDTETTDDGVSKLIAAVLVPQEGTYLVSASADGSGQLPAAELTFGLSPLGAVVERFKDVVDKLNGPTGIIVLIALGALLLAPRVGRALGR